MTIVDAIVPRYGDSDEATTLVSSGDRGDGVVTIDGGGGKVVCNDDEGGGTPVSTTF